MAFSELYELMADQMYRLARVLVNDRQEAEDAVQTAFLELARVGNPPRRGAALEAWLLSSIRQSCRRAVQAQARHEDIADEYLPVTNDEDDYDLGLDPDLEVALSLLTPEQQLVIHLKHVDGLDGHQIAQVTGTSRMAVYAMASRAERRLQRDLGAIQRQSPRSPVARGKR